MGKDDNKMKSKAVKVLLIVLFMGSGCEEIIPHQEADPTVEFTTGWVEFVFPLQMVEVPDISLHRIDLSIARAASDLYQGNYVASANVSDYQVTYIFELAPGNYYYQAGMTCSSLGDTCMWGGFPGGRFGSKWTLGTIEIELGKSVAKTITFQ